MSKQAHHAPVAFLLVALAGAASPSFAQDHQVVRRFEAGLGVNAVGVVDASEDEEIAAPQAIYAGEGNQIYLLDQVNGRVLGFDPTQASAPTRSFQLPSDMLPTDLIVRRGQIVVWDGNVHVLRPNGPDDAPTRGLEEVPTRGVDDPFTVSEFAQMGSQKPGSDTDLFNENTRSLSQSRAPNRQYVNSRSRGPLVANVTADADKSGARIEIAAQGQTAPFARLQMKVRDRLGVSEVLEVDRQGRVFVLGENIPATASDGASVFVARYTSSGALEGVYDLPLSQSVAPSRRFVTVSENGDVFFLRTQKTGVDVLGVGFRALRGKVIDVGRRTPTYDFLQGKKGKGPIVAVGPLTRQRVVETAFAFESIRWRVNPGAYGRDPDQSCTGFNRVRRPGYLHGKLNQEVRGMPYCWGCHGSLQQVSQKIERGALAGNWCTRNQPRSDTAGVDCSAFVSACWGLATHFTTSAIPAITKRLDNPWDLQPGDALNKPGSHVMLFLRFTVDRKAEVIEASTGGCNGRVCRNVYPLASLLARGYAPVRYRALANEAVAKVTFPAEPQAKGPDKPAKAQAKGKGRVQ